VLGERHLEERDFWTDVELGAERIRLPGMGYRLSATPARLGRVPRLDEHGSEAPAVHTASGGRGGEASRPLAGMRAIEFGFNWAGPMVGQILADMGMQVIKIETAGRLDFMRHWPHARSFFHNTNRGKLSVAINIKTDQGRELVRRLAAQSDLVFDNFAAGVLAKNGLGYDDLRRAAPHIVAVSMAMAGQHGSLAHLRGFATIATGFAGIEAAIGYPETGSTGLPVIGVGDANAAIQAVLAALAALWHRRRTGEGQFVDLSQIEAAAALAGEPLARLQIAGTEIAPSANAHPRLAPHGVYPARGEDRWLALAIASDGEWRTLVDLLGAPPWAADEGLAALAQRQSRTAEIDAHLAEWTGQRERDELVEELSAAGLAAAPVLDIEELHTWPQFAARGIWQMAPSFEGGDDIVYRTPWHLGGAPREVAAGSPRVGEHNDLVLAEILAMPPDEIAALRESGALA